MRVELKVYDDNGENIFEAGAIDTGEGLAGIFQRLLHIYETKDDRDAQYARSMGRAAALYREEIAALQRFGFADITQTGGMCLALEVFLTDDFNGPQLLITSRDDSLPWQRDGDEGWMACYGRDRDSTYGEEDDGLYDKTDDTTVEALVALVAGLIAAHHKEA